MTETSDEEDEYAWMDAYLQSCAPLHEMECTAPSCPSRTTLYMAWCGQHGMKECGVYKNKKPPKTCGMLSCMLESGEMTL